MKSLLIFLSLITVLLSNEYNWEYLPRLHWVSEQSNTTLEHLEPFYPIGWSEDGTHFAYFVEPNTEAMGHYALRLVIQNMKTDAVVYDWYSINDPSFEELAETYFANFSGICSRRNAELSEKLSEYGILQKRVEVVPGDLIRVPDDFAMKYLIELDAESDSENLYNEVSVAKITVSQQRSRGFGADFTPSSKVIYNKSYRNEEGYTHPTAPLQCEIYGAIWNPLFDRFLVILGETHRGWEGPPHVQRIKLIGCSVTTGF